MAAQVLALPFELPVFEMLLITLGRSSWHRRFYQRAVSQFGLTLERN
jgi:hypothetical protein